MALSRRPDRLKRYRNVGGKYGRTGLVRAPGSGLAPADEPVFTLLSSDRTARRR